MSTSKVITNFENLTDDALDLTATSIITGCTANPAFVFAPPAAIANLATTQANYHTALAAVTSGNHGAVSAKETARIALQKAMSNICQQINTQAAGNLAKLQTTGAPLAKTPVHQPMTVPLGFVVKHGKISGSVVASVEKPSVSDHGTVFVYTLVANINTDPNTWRFAVSTGHSRTIKGLTAGQTYAFTCAYIGLDTEDLVWCPAVSLLVV